jgi:Uma2 family endonuclease
MSAPPQHRYSLAEYLKREETAYYKSQFYHGEIFAMTGGTPNHNTAAGNTFASLHEQLRGSGCRPFNSDQRIRIPANGLLTYPDISVVCGDLELDDQDPNAINNPLVIVEVLSKSTESYDRGKKFDLYRELPSLREYLLISQETPHIERFVRQDDGTWNLAVFKGLDAELDLQSVNVKLTLAAVYNNVTFPPEEEATGTEASA